jgi:NAD dependent epimerase/dehydratase family enzyme
MPAISAQSRSCASCRRTGARNILPATLVSVQNLTVAETLYLVRDLRLDEATRGAIERASVSLQEVLTPRQADAIRDLCGERLQQVGFNENYKPTPEGRLLETLVDKFYIEE